MRPPRALQPFREKDRHRVRGVAGAVALRAEQPEEPLVTEQGRVEDFAPGEQHPVPHPAVGKLAGAVQDELPAGAALRDHPHLAVMSEHLRVRQVPGLFQHLPRRAENAVRAALADGDDPLAAGVDELLHEDELPALPVHRDRVGVEPVAVVRQHGPCRSAERQRLGDPRAVVQPVADAPVRAVVAQVAQRLPRQSRQCRREIRARQRRRGRRCRGGGRRGRARAAGGRGFVTVDEVHEQRDRTRDDVVQPAADERAPVAHRRRVRHVLAVEVEVDDRDVAAAQDRRGGGEIRLPLEPRGEHRRVPAPGAGAFRQVEHEPAGPTRGSSRVERRDRCREARLRRAANAAFGGEERFQQPVAAAARARRRDDDIVSRGREPVDGEAVPAARSLGRQHDLHRRHGLPGRQCTARRRSPCASPHSNRS